jgi:peptidoglycan/xylan/chitin deacetylase (PgdA/CDA1 family)
VVETALGLFGAAGMLLLVLAVDWLSRRRSFQFFGQSVDRVETAAKAVAMTFDDGPNPPYTEEILAILDRYSVKATFFLVGKHIRSFPDTARRIAEAGHVVGNHSFSHRRLVYEYPHSSWRYTLRLHSGHSTRIKPERYGISSPLPEPAQLVVG